MDTTDKNILAFEGLKEQLEAESMGQWALIHEGKLIKVFSNFESAAEEAVKKFGSGPYLIRQVGAPPVTLPASAVFNID